MGRRLANESLPGRLHQRDAQVEQTEGTRGGWEVGGPLNMAPGKHAIGLREVSRVFAAPCEPLGARSFGGADSERLRSLRGSTP